MKLTVNEIRSMVANLPDRTNVTDGNGYINEILLHELYRHPCNRMNGPRGSKR